MKIWLMHLGETLLSDEAGRLYRYGYLAEALERRGHQVTRWAPTFVHATKTFRADKDLSFTQDDGVKIELLDAGAYRKNVSVQRILFHRKFARKFATRSRQLEKPDLIVCGLPVLELCSRAVKFGKKNDIPVIIDIRDLWPDIYLELFPEFLRSAAKGLLTPLYRKTAAALRDATRLTAVSRQYLDWGVDLSGRSEEEPGNKVFYIGYSRPTIVEPDREEANRFWNRLGIDGKRTTLAFVGTICESIDLRPIIETARQVPQCDFVLCGAGESLGFYKELAKGLDNVVFPGWIGQEKVMSLLGRAHMAHVGYGPGALQSLPNKPFEYMAGGVPIISTLKGELTELLEHWGAGLYCRPGDAEALTKIVADFVDDEDLQKTMAENSMKMFSSVGNSENIYRDYACYLEGILSENG